MRLHRKRRSRRLISIGLILCSALSCHWMPLGPRSDGGASRVALSDGWLAMGTFFELELRVDPADRRAATDWIRWTRSEIDRLERIYSRHDIESELSRLNRRLAHAERGSIPIPIGPELAGLIDQAQRARRATQGSFDITVAPLVELWSQAARQGVRPPPDSIGLALARVGGETFEYAPSGLRMVEGSGPPLDLDAISKGAVLDRLHDSFVARFGDAAALLSFGQSSIAAIGDPDGRGWHMVVRSNDPERGNLGEIVLRDQSLSMSSSLGRVIEVDGDRFSHVIDPRTGWPVVGTVEAVVIAESATQADAWSTALLVLGKLPAAIEADLPAGFEVLLVDAEGMAFRTSGWPAVADE